MKYKIFSLIALAIGILLLIVGIVLPGAIVSNGSVDFVTYRFRVPHLSACFVLLGAALIMSALFCLVFSKTVKKNCRIQTSLVALSLPAVGGAGLVCFLVWLPIAVFGGRDQYPVAYPYSLFLGAVCFFSFLGLCALYVVLRKKNSSILGVLLDVLTSILYLPGFFLILFYISELLNN